MFMLIDRAYNIVQESMRPENLPQQSLYTWLTILDLALIEYI